jgi:hypothetical protein
VILIIGHAGMEFLHHECETKALTVGLSRIMKIPLFTKVGMILDSGSRKKLVSN